MGCSLTEARRQVFSSQGQAILADPWSTAVAVEPPVVLATAVEPPVDVAGVVESASVIGDDGARDKENRDNGDVGQPGAVASACDPVPSKATPVEAGAEGAAEAGAEEAAEAGTEEAAEAGTEAEPEPESGGGAHRAATGLIALNGNSAIICAPGAGIRAFDFDYAWGDASEQAEIYASAVAPLVANVLNGRSACVLAYGQTGSGKTHTMSGASLRPTDPASEAQLGMVPRAVGSILRACEDRAASLGVVSKVSLACIEVFGELVSDLLHERQDGEGGGVGGFWAGVTAAATAAGFADVPVDSYDHALSLLETAERSKRRAATAMNERSSRAHSLIILSLEQEAREGEGRVRSVLCLCDLGGCEKVKKSNATGDRLQEAININQGLLALKSVVTALNQGRSYVPYQDAKLTYLLKRSLAAGAKTLVLLAARPEAEHSMETFQALRFGETCAQIEVSAHNGTGAGRAAALALDALDAQIAQLEEQIRDKERFETRVVRIRDERAGLLDGSGFGSTLTDFSEYEKKVSVIVGAEKERAQLEKILAARRALVFGE